MLIDHYAIIGSNVQIGNRACISTQCQIGNNIKIPPGAIIQPRQKLLTQSDLNKYIQKSQYNSSSDALQSSLTNTKQDKLLHSN